MRLEEMDIEVTPDVPLWIDVEAAALNYFDVLQIAGSYQFQPQMPFVPGAEVAGIVLQASVTSGFARGERVMAWVEQRGLAEGGYTQTTRARPEYTVRMPSDMPFEIAAAFFISYHSAWFGLHRRASLRRGEVVLVHGAAGGIGSAAVQLAKAAGAVVIATAGAPEKIDACRMLGADLVIDYSHQDFVKATKEFTQGRGADIVFDPVGGAAFEASTKCVAFEGRIVTAGFASGHVPTIRVNHALIKNYSVVGLHFGLYAHAAPQLIPPVTKELLRLYGAGAIRPMVSRVLPMEGAIEGLNAIAQRRAVGKIVLLPRESG